MSDELQARLRAEMSEQQRPPLDDVVARAVREGSRSVRRRRALAGFGATATAAVAVVAVALAGQALAGHASSPEGAGLAAGGAASVAASPVPNSASPAPAPASPVVSRVASPVASVSATSAAAPGSAPAVSAPASPVPAASVPTSASPVASPGSDAVAATPAGLLELLTKLLPPGTTSDAGAANDGSLHVQIYLDAGAGPGMVRLSVYKDMSAPGAASAECGQPGATCMKLLNGDLATVLQLPDNCIQRTVVQVDHANGTGVQIDIASCLEWNGSANVAAPQPLTADQAIAIADDPRWGVRMDPALVAAGGRDFPSLHQFG